MKVKENLSKDFVYNNEKKEQKTLKEKGNLQLIEQKVVRGYLDYSRYLLNDKKYNVNYINIGVKDPIEESSDLHKDIYLKYQIGLKTFLLDLFDVIVKEKEDIEPAYKTKQKQFFECEVDKNNYSVLIKTKEDGYLFGIIQMKEDKDFNLDLANKILKFFIGEKVSFKDISGVNYEDNER